MVNKRIQISNRVVGAISSDGFSSPLNKHPHGQKRFARHMMVVAREIELGVVIMRQLSTNPLDSANE